MGGVNYYVHRSCKGIGFKLSGVAFLPILAILHSGEQLPEWKDKITEAKMNEMGHA